MKKSSRGKRTAFVTGATGFIGSRLVDRLLKDGYKVKVLVRNSSNYQSLEDKGCEIIIGDLADVESIKKGTKGVDFIFNVAAGLPHHKLPEKVYFKINTDGVKNILEACLSAQVKRIVHISTVGIYGSTTNKGINEKSLTNPGDAYSKSKLEAEKVIYEYITKFNLPITIIRPTIGYGPGDTRPGFLNLFKLIESGIFVPVGSGTNYFHTIYVDNLIDAMLLAAINKKAIGEDFIIGDKVCPTMRQIIETIANVEHKKLLPFSLPIPIAIIIAVICDIAQKFGFPAFLNSTRLKFITDIRKYDTSKAEKLLGYKPKISLEEGINRTYEWYKKNGYLI